MTRGKPRRLRRAARDRLMEPVREVEGRAIPFGASNVDTDVIIPAHWLKTVTREGLGRGALATLLDMCRVTGCDVPTMMAAVARGLISRTGRPSWPAGLNETVSCCSRPASFSLLSGTVCTARPGGHP